jgi:hypothetical protein
VALSDWATCHLVIGPYNPVTNIVSTTSVSCHPTTLVSCHPTMSVSCHPTTSLLYSHVSYPEPTTSSSVLPSQLSNQQPRQHSYNQVTQPHQHPSNHVSIRTTTCHSYCHVSACHLATSASIQCHVLHLYSARYQFLIGPH